jgi:hypothetical protein
MIYAIGTFLAVFFLLSPSAWGGNDAEDNPAKEAMDQLADRDPYRIVDEIEKRNRETLDGILGRAGIHTGYGHRYDKAPKRHYRYHYRGYKHGGKIYHYKYRSRSYHHGGHKKHRHSPRYGHRFRGRGIPYRGSY